MLASDANSLEWRLKFLDPLDPLLLAPFPDYKKGCWIADRLSLFSACDSDSDLKVNLKVT